MEIQDMLDNNRIICWFSIRSKVTDRAVDVIYTKMKIGINYTRWFNISVIK